MLCLSMHQLYARRNVRIRHHHTPRGRMMKNRSLPLLGQPPPRKLGYLVDRRSTGRGLPAPAASTTKAAHNMMRHLMASAITAAARVLRRSCAAHCRCQCKKLERVVRVSSDFQRDSLSAFRLAASQALLFRASRARLVAFWQLGRNALVLVRRARPTRKRDR